MENLKIQVNSADESKEAQELFLKLGYKDRKNWTQRNPIHESIQAWKDGEFTFSLNHNQVPVGFKEITLPELRAMVNPMKEYLDKKPDGTYSLVLRGGACKKSDILIPEGANVYARCNIFGDYKLLPYAVDGDWDILWQRDQDQDEPFLTPECTLNDQYAEIEQAGLKFDNGKPRHSLLPRGSISSIIAVLEFGAKKYEANNWQKVDNAKERYYDAAMRHIDSWWNGEKFDQETGIHHLAHAATNLFFLKWFDDKGE